MPILALFMLHTQRGSAQQVLFSINQHTSLNTDLTPLRNQISDRKKSKCCGISNNLPTVLHEVQMCAAFYNPKSLPTAIQTIAGYTLPLSKVEETCLFGVVFFSNIPFMISSMHSLALENW